MTKKGRISVFYDSCAVFGAEGRLRVTEIFDSFLDGKKGRLSVFTANIPKKRCLRQKRRRRQAAGYRVFTHKRCVFCVMVMLHWQPNSRHKKTRRGINQASGSLLLDKNYRTADKSGFFKIFRKLKASRRTLLDNSYFSLRYSETNPLSV